MGVLCVKYPKIVVSIGGIIIEEKKIYKPKYPVSEIIEQAKADYVHTQAHQVAYDFCIYLHLKVRGLPKYEKFTLQKDIRASIDKILDEIEEYEITKVISHLYSADRAKRALVRYIRMANDLKYSAINDRVLFYCSKQMGIIGALIGGLIKEAQEKKKKQIIR